MTNDPTQSTEQTDSHGPVIGRRDACNICLRPFRASEARLVSIPCNIRKFSGQRFSVWRCAQCGCIHCRDIVDLGVYYAGYPSQREHLDLISRIMFFEQLRRFRKAGLNSEHRLLDYGCGYGNFVQYLRSRGYSRAVGYDPYSPVTAIRDDRVLEQGSFDYICLQEVIEHVEDPLSLLRMLAGLLRIGGILLVGMPSADDIDLDNPLKYTHALHAPYHLHIYTKQTLIDLTSKVSLSPIAWYRRMYVESPLFGMNEAFVRHYANRIDGTADSLTEPIRVPMILRSPSLLFHGAFGYLYSGRRSIGGFFKKLS